MSSAGDMAVLLNSRQVRSYIHVGTLARVPLSGGGPREILNNVQWADWSPDGREIAIVRDVGDHLQQREQRDHHAHADETELLGGDREDEVGVRLGQVVELEDAAAQAHAAR